MRAALLLLLLPRIACAASFDCARAQDALQRAICANPALSKADEQMAQAISQNALIFGDGSSAGGPVIADLEQAQAKWLAQRRDCAGNVGCLTQAYAEQLAVLEFRGRPGKQEAADRVAGLYSHEGWANLWIQVRDDNSVRVSLSSLPPSGGRCSTAAVATIDGKVVKAGLLEILVDRRQAEIPVTENNLTVNRTGCLGGGSILWHYFAR